MRQKMIITAFDNIDHAGMAVDELEEMGYDEKEISVIAKEDRTVRETGGTKAGEGAVTGGAIGGLAGLLAGAGVLPALAGILAGGPLIAALGLAGIAATTATGAAAGGLIGALVGVGIPRESAEMYDRTVREGGVVLGVPIENEEEAEDVRAIFSKHGADRIDEVHSRQESA